MSTLLEELIDGDDSKRVLNLGRTGVYLSAIEGDVRTLMRTFQRLQSFEFESFREIWKALNFSLIHFVATEKNSRQNFMRTTYRLILGHFQPSAILEIRIGVVYALYLMYFTQPVNFPNISIRVTIDMWNMLTKLYQYCREADIRDAVYVFERLVNNGAFEHVAWMDENEGILRLDGDEDGIGSKVAAKLAQIEHEVMGSAQGNLGDLSASKRQIALSEDYRNNKRKLVNTRLIMQATREFYAAEFGPQVLQNGELPGAVPLDISDQDTAWSSHIFSRVREYQRNRADRVGAVAEDDGSLHVKTDFNEGFGRQRTSGEFRPDSSELATTPIGAIQRAEDNLNRRRHTYFGR
ncbi:hypothetical protein LPJ78_000082 [Coemansia sp. RSA 989]|nr:small nuclear RNA activating complex, subunit SNAP43-domain-containing protein [Coemansia mojavensis]KAJ1744377.1 hypothetical protein LPJ68_000057 [Coemansia sp. RSA 1086]KAJ1753608.1 hypothetical protein LPJ79_000201 [Coemansia sp. RSA 1821]KAJ1868570.1 hypothetical protein LPJ78_000082 [Coemansia sp. RSA 989]KAJ1876181.1 hypothetical protein LPJ55_000083 [Coemansia sp. RSA 990]KAJ2633971.1 hypothetical protein H4R22_000059 [Coemansia sp. RSA 1290]KAJ2652308.1 hypothetical protein IWW40_